MRRGEGRLRGRRLRRHADRAGVALPGSRASGPPGRGKGREARAALGRRAEDAAALRLSAEGYAILSRNARVGRLEVDVLARQGDVVVLVEVRARGPGAWVGPLASVDEAKRARLRRAGETLWRTRFRDDPSVARLRFDIVAVRFDEAGRAAIEHVKAAF